MARLTIFFKQIQLSVRLGNQHYRQRASLHLQASIWRMNVTLSPPSDRRRWFFAVTERERQSLITQFSYCNNLTTDAQDCVFSARFIHCNHLRFPYRISFGVCVMSSSVFIMFSRCPAVLSFFFCAVLRSGTSQLLLTTNPKFLLLQIN